MSDSPISEPSSRTRGLKIHDLIGLVIGYALAALLLRSIWQSTSTPAARTIVMLCAAYVWLGLAMSGPLILLADRRARPERHNRAKPRRILEISVDEPISREVAAPSRFGSAEIAWILIGAYWIALTLVIVPLRARDTPWPLLGFFQLTAVAAIRLSRPRGGDPPGGDSWKRTAAIGLLYSWPITWCLLIVLSTTLW